MKVKRVVIQRLKALADRDDLFCEEPESQPLSSICLRGINGSGKTTYLEAIAQVWQWFRRWLQQGPVIGTAGGPPEVLIAIHLVGLPGPLREVWLVYGKQQDWDKVPNKGTIPAIFFVIQSPPKDPMDEEFRTFWTFWGEGIVRLEHQSLAGTPPPPLPNIVHLGAEERVVHPLLDKSIGQLEPEPDFQWLMSYTPTAEKKGHIENSLVAMLLVNPERFRRIADQLHQIWPHLTLMDRPDHRTLRPRFQLDNGKAVLLEDLSAGERAALIAFFSIARWLTPGGIVLLDEPELHQHLSLMRRNLATLDRFVTHEMKGQLIVTSHAPEVWNHFRAPGSIIDLNPSRADQGDAA